MIAAPFQRAGRSPALGSRHMAATSHPRATLAALDVLARGGNAVDAALAASAVLTVVEPHMTGIGGDCFVLLAPAGGAPVALNGSGRAPAAADPEAIAAEGHARIPPDGGHAVTVPGALAAWDALHRAYGSRPLAELLAPAVAAAREGVPAAPRVAWDWGRAVEKLAARPATRATFLRDGRAPEAGEVVRLPALAATLETIGRDGVEAFYRGALTGPMLRTLADAGGVHTADDFAAAAAEWVEPIRTDYRGVRIWQCPPNGQGVVALLLLNMLEGVAPGWLPFDGPDWPHWLAEATRLAYRERDAEIADPARAAVPTTGLLDKAFARELAAEIDVERAMTRLPPRLVPPHPDTVHLSVVDGDGTAVSFINSIYDGFGSGITCPRTGVLFHNRGRAFRLEAGHPNRLEPGKRPLHTIIPGLAYKDGAPWLAFGVMGGDYQAVGHAQLIKALVDHGLDPQAALELPRSFAYPEGLQVEATIAPDVVAALAARGHHVRPAAAPLGGGQAILIDRARGVLVGGSDPRKDGVALGL